MKLRPVLFLGLCAALAGAFVHAGDKPAQAATNGAMLYNDRCAMCHEVNGQGTPGSFPPLAGNPHVVVKDPSPLIVEVLEGMPLTDIVVQGRHYGGGMPAWGNWLSDAEVASIVTYMRNAWGNQASPVTAQQVAKLRKTPFYHD